jgi:hypothetical protein
MLGPQAHQCVRVYVCVYGCTRGLTDAVSPGTPRTHVGTPILLNLTADLTHVHSAWQLKGAQGKPVYLTRNQENSEKSVS